ncbi:response regulator [Azospirillum doebereinerae]|uniref:histidine kinase n=1 Tax=Azospirillum doebereinerae TaxID=92933 RepID=A0A3S0XNF2_9PROT|nr:response regulator [Azospirillum doebereinerae]RUQ72161.1 response regulator [Azospirillum doebereinerae]
MLPGPSAAPPSAAADGILEDLRRELTEAQARLREAEDTIDAIRNGEVDAVVVASAEGHQVYTLENADRPYRVLIEQMQEGAVTLNASGVVLYCNQRLATLLETPQERIVGGAFTRFVPAEDRATFAWLLSGSTEDGGRGEFTLMAAGDLRVPVHLSFAVLPGMEERILCGVVTDLTQQRRRNHELAETNARLVAEIAERERAEAKLRQAQKMEAVGQLTGGIAHDFNNLLMIITGNLELARGRLGAEERVVPLLTQAMGAAERGAQLTKQLLAFSRRQNLQPQVLDIHTLLPALVPLVRHAVGAAIVVELVEAAELWHCRIDPHQFENALLNLAINARDAMPEGGCVRIVTENVTLDESVAFGIPDAHPGRYVAVSVGDSGHGMDADTMERAFEPFFTTKDVGKGSGLGLSMIYGFVRQSGGFVTLRSVPGQGTRVTLHLPWAAPQDAVEPVPVPPVPLMENGQGTVLVVEDDEDVRRLVVQLVEASGYTVIDADSGTAALAVLAENAAIDLLFSDVVMPHGMNGIDLARVVRQRHPDVSILLTSGFTAGNRVRDPVLEMEFPVLRKPYRHEELAGAIHHALGQRPRLPSCAPASSAPDVAAPAADEAADEAPDAEPSRPRVLLVEDETLVAMAVEAMLDDLGYAVVGPASTLDEALSMARSEPFDAALLDVSLAGVHSYPVADLLAARGIPFVFATGYGAASHPEPHMGAPTLAKPYGVSQLTGMLTHVLPAPRRR